MRSKKERLDALDTLYVQIDGEGPYIPKSRIEVMAKAGWQDDDCATAKYVVVGNIAIARSPNTGKFLALRYHNEHGWTPVTAGHMDNEWFNLILPYHQKEETEENMARFRGVVDAFSVQCVKERNDKRRGNPFRKA